MNRRKARELAFALIFEKSFSPETDMETIIETAVEQRLIELDDFSLELAKAASRNMEQIDSIIESNSIAWRKNRISRVALAILRMAICEMLYFDAIPISVSINEAVDICKVYAEKEDASFVNGILGSVSKKICSGPETAVSESETDETDESADNEEQAVLAADKILMGDEM